MNNSKIGSFKVLKISIAPQNSESQNSKMDIATVIIMSKELLDIKLATIQGAHYSRTLSTTELCHLSTAL